jgi:hypothetical protein
MNIRGLHTRLDKIENSAPRAIVTLWGHPTIAEQREAIKLKARAMNIPDSAVDLHIVRWFDVRN